MVSFDLHRLRILRELQERGTLAAVAAALGYSPSAISQQVAVLEKEVGVRLLEKVGRGVRLTEAGLLLATHADVMLAAADVAAADLEALHREVRGTVRACGLQSVAARLLIPAVATLRRDHPRLRVQISEVELETALPALRLGSVDLVVSDEYHGHPRPRPTGLRFSPLMQESLGLVLPLDHPLALRSAAVDLAALRNEVWVTSAVGTGHHTMVVGTCRALGGFDPDVQHFANDGAIQLELVRSLGAVALLPRLVLPADDTVAIRSVAGTELGRSLVLVTRDGPASPALTALVHALRGRAGSISAGRAR